MVLVSLELRLIQSESDTLCPSDNKDWPKTDYDNRVASHTSGAACCARDVVLMFGLVSLYCAM